METAELQKVDCTGDACKGDYVFFEKAVFTGRYPKGKFSHMESIEGEIVSDSYGEKKQQHTFTIKLPSGSTMRIKGRNLYRNGCQRLVWGNEQEREQILKDKHERGNKAREKASARKEYHTLNDYDYDFANANFNECEW